MKHRIEEVHNYFLNKITACEFEMVSLRCEPGSWAELKITIDGQYDFNLSISTAVDVIMCWGFMNLNIPFSRTKNLIEYIEKHNHLAKQQRIAELEKELEKARA